MTIIEPKELIEKLKTPYIFGSTATFGTPYYGSRLVGKVQYFDTSGCTLDDYDLSPSSIPTIVAVWRDVFNCTFIQKALIAEKKGAKAILIIDSKNSGTVYKDIRKIIMSKGDFVGDVEIPALLIGETEGKGIINTKEDVILELSWSMPKLPWVEMDLWISPAFTESLKFLEEFYAYAIALGNKLDFFPHYWVVSLKGAYDDKCWDKEGNFCSLNADWDNSVTGKEILKEIVREVCLYESTFEDNETFSKKWWEYMSKLRNKCTLPNNDGKTSFDEKCSFDLMASVGANRKEIEKCYEERALSILSNEKLTEAWSPMAVLINGWHYSGSLEADTVSRAVCTGFKELPRECNVIFDETEKIGVDSNIFRGLGTVSIIFISLVVSLFAILVISLAVWKFVYPKFKNKMRYAVMKEVHNEIQKQKGGSHMFENRGIGNPSQFTIYNN